jgi:predicted kinase
MGDAHSMSILISLSGLPGVGKTTVARALAQKISAVYIRVDSIEVALKNSALRIHPAEDAGYLVAVAVAKDNLAHGLDVVADTVNPISVTREWWAEAAKVCNARLLNVEIICSDRVEHRRRIEQRRNDIEGLELPDWDHVQRREYEGWRQDRVVLDTGKLSADQCVERIVEWREAIDRQQA